MIINDKKGENMVLINGIDYIELESVGSTLTKDLKVFPQLCNETPETASEADEMMGVHIYDLDNEWFHNLSSDDLKYPKGNLKPKSCDFVCNKKIVFKIKGYRN